VEHEFKFFLFPSTPFTLRKARMACAHDQLTGDGYGRKHCKHSCHSPDVCLIGNNKMEPVETSQRIITKLT